MPFKTIPRYKISALRATRHFVLHFTLYIAAAALGVFAYFSASPTIASFAFKISNSLTDLESAPVEQERHELSQHKAQTEAHSIDESLARDSMTPSRTTTHRL